MSVLNPVHHDQLFLRDEVYRLVGAALEVLNHLGHGFLEKPYENALIAELKSLHIPFQQQPMHEILYKGVKVGVYTPDLVVYDSIVVDLKVIKAITNMERGQMLNYLKVTNLRVGVILNFANPRLEWERLVR